MWVVVVKMSGGCGSWWWCGVSVGRVGDVGWVGVVVVDGSAGL